MPAYRYSPENNFVSISIVSSPSPWPTVGTQSIFLFEWMNAVWTDEEKYQCKKQVSKKKSKNQS